MNASTEHFFNINRALDPKTQCVCVYYDNFQSTNCFTNWLIIDWNYLKIGHCRSNALSVSAFITIAMNRTYDSICRLRIDSFKKVNKSVCGRSKVKEEEEEGLEAILSDGFCHLFGHRTHSADNTQSICFLTFKCFQLLIDWIEFVRTYTNRIKNLTTCLIIFDDDHLLSSDLVQNRKSTFYPWRNFVLLHTTWMQPPPLLAFLCMHSSTSLISLLVNNCNRII